MIVSKLFIYFFLVWQMNSCPAVGNGGFPFSSLPNGNVYYSENK